MGEFWQAIMTAGSLIWELDAVLWEIIGLSLQVSLTATGIAAVIGLPVGALIALGHFRGQRVLIVIFNALMGLPPVVVGLVVYLLLSRAGPFGVLDLLFTPTAMIIAQIILVLPIIVSLSRETIETLWQEYHEALRSLGASHSQALITLLWDGRGMLITALLAGFGRAVAEVGAVMIVGGNIDHVTLRVRMVKIPGMACDWGAELTIHSNVRWHAGHRQTTPQTTPQSMRQSTYGPLRSLIGLAADTSATP